jgi:hypothetical protein
MTQIAGAAMAKQAEKRGRGRPPKHGEAMTGATRIKIRALKTLHVFCA